MANSIIKSQLAHPDPKINIREFLIPAAKMAGDLAVKYCLQHGNENQSCAWYHHSWPVLRALGVFHSLASDDDFLVRAINHEIHRGARRILVCGTADAGMLARVAACVENFNDFTITVLDRCEAPLQLNLLFAEQSGFEIQTVCGDILNATEFGEPFDLICTHSFITFFSSEDRIKLVSKWHSLLKRGGAVVTAQRVRPNETDLITRFTAQEIERLAKESERLATEKYEATGIAPAQARQLGKLYGEKHCTHLISSEVELSQLFTEQHFILEEFAPPDADVSVHDKPGAPANPLACRWRVHARKP